MSDKIRRVYHPTLNAFHDIPKADEAKWKAAGWRLTKPPHVDESDAPKVGEGRGYVDIAREIPLLEDTSTTTTTSTTTATTGGATTATTGAGTSAT